MCLTISIAGRLKQVLVGAVLMVSAVSYATETPLNKAAGNSAIATGEVKYELPHDLGVLSMQIPLHWVGGRAEGVEALWIDQHGSPFKDNVTLVIRSGNKVPDSEALLNKTMTSMINNIQHTAASDIKSKEGGRMVAFDRVIKGQEITQTSMVIYRESVGKSYLLTLTYSRPQNTETVDLTKVTVR